MGPLVSTGFLHQPRSVPPHREGNEDSSKYCAPSAFTLHLLTKDALVPPVCPNCGAPGLHPRPITQQDAATQNPTLLSHYCDICAQSLEDDSTRRLATTLSASIIAVAFATTVTFWWGLRFAFLQWLGVLFTATCLPLVAKHFGLWRVSSDLVEEVKSSASNANQRTLLVKSAAFTRALNDAGLPAHETVFTPDLVLSEKIQRVWPIFSVPALALSWWTLLHFAGVAPVRVLYGGERSATLLIDGRHSGVISASYSEDPEAGQIHRVLGGRRKFELISSDGRILAEQSEILWPGHTYIIAVLPPDKCLFSETLDYGNEGQGNLFVPLTGRGPLWEVEGQVDSWFQALAARNSVLSPQSDGNETRDPAQIAEQSLSGGTRRAIRLLPCRASLSVGQGVSQ